MTQNRIIEEMRRLLPHGKQPPVIYALTPAAFTLLTSILRQKKERRKRPISATAASDTHTG